MAFLYKSWFLAVSPSRRLLRAGGRVRVSGTEGSPVIAAPLMSSPLIWPLKSILWGGYGEYMLRLDGIQMLTYLGDGQEISGEEFGGLIGR